MEIRTFPRDYEENKLKTHPLYDNFVDFVESLPRNTLSIEVANKLLAQAIIDVATEYVKLEDKTLKLKLKRFLPTILKELEKEAPHRIKQ